MRFSDCFSLQSCLTSEHFFAVQLLRGQLAPNDFISIFSTAMRPCRENAHQGLQSPLPCESGVPLSICHRTKLMYKQAAFGGLAVTLLLAAVCPAQKSSNNLTGAVSGKVVTLDGHAAENARNCTTSSLARVCSLPTPIRPGSSKSSMCTLATISS